MTSRSRRPRGAGSRRRRGTGRLPTAGPVSMVPTPWPPGPASRRPLRHGFTLPPPFANCVGVQSVVSRARTFCRSPGRPPTSSDCLPLREDLAALVARSGSVHRSSRSAGRSERRRRLTGGEVDGLLQPGRDDPDLADARGLPAPTLPYETLLARLHAPTNLRIVPDSGSETGCKLEIGPFPRLGRRAGGGSGILRAYLTLVGRILHNGGKLEDPWQP
jgi:hypothetical protein